jgi:hypothetical protein
MTTFFSRWGSHESPSCAISLRVWFVLYPCVFGSWNVTPAHPAPAYLATFVLGSVACRFGSRSFLRMRSLLPRSRSSSKRSSSSSSSSRRRKRSSQRRCHSSR